MTRTWAISIAISLLSCAILFGCSSKSSPGGAQSPPTPQTVTRKEPAFYTGKPCLTRMADLAVRWQPDALPFHMESGLNAESTGRDGKSTIWRALFASPSRGTYKTFMCSGSRLPDEAPFGVTSTSETAYAPNVPQLIFQPVYLTTNSDKAFTMAQEKGGAALLEKDPQQPVFYSLDWDSKQKELLWVVIYGASRSASKGVGVINASTGKFLRAGK